MVNIAMLNRFKDFPLSLKQQHMNNISYNKMYSLYISHGNIEIISTTLTIVSVLTIITMLTL